MDKQEVILRASCTKATTLSEALVRRLRRHKTIIKNRMDPDGPWRKRV